MQSIAGAFAISVLYLVATAPVSMAADCSQLGATPAAQVFIPCLEESARQIDRLTHEVDRLNTELGHLKNELSTFKSSLYGDIDAVYTISNSFTRDDVKNLKTDKQLVYLQYIYADMEKHRVRAVIYRRQNSFGLRFCINNLCSIRKNDINEDITELLKKNHLKPDDAGAGGELFNYPAHIQLIKLQPISLTWDAGDRASIEGYIIVQRATSEDGAK